MYTWRLAQPEEVNGVCELFCASTLWHGDSGEIQRRIITPLLLKHLITFYNDKKELCGFITFAFLNDEAEHHMPTTGISATDWKSGNHFWAVDYVVKHGEHGYKMLRLVTKNLNVKKARYFRDKFKEVREVNAS